MLKPLTAEGRFEAGIDNVVKGKVWAYVAVTGEHYGARLGIAIANQQGYNPVPEHWAHADTYDEMSAHADELNEAEGLSKWNATEVVISTMGGKPVLLVKDAEGNVSADWQLAPGSGRRRRRA